MTDQSAPSTFTVIPAPSGLSILDSDGWPLPIVALRIEDKGASTPDITALYMDHDESIGPIAHDVKIATSSAWTPTSTVNDNRGSFFS